MANENKNRIKKPFQPKELLMDAGVLLLGSFLFAVAVNLFILPGRVVVGGLTGISTVVHMLFHTPVGVVIMALNVPLMLIYGYNYGFRRLAKTVLSVIFTSVATDVITFLPITNEDPLFCSILGGACMGLACGILFTRGFTSGGTDLVAYVLKKRFKNISTGRFILIIDVMIIVGATLFTKNYIGVFYSLITTFVWTKVIDFVLDSTGKAKLVFVMSEKYKEISDQVTGELTRGVTVLDGKGWYTKQERPVLMCAVKRTEVFRLKQIIQSADPHAFVICSEANEVLGQGFDVAK